MESAALGKKTFEHNCIFCHGPEGSGGKVKALRNSTLTSELIFQTISNGRIRAGNVMPAWKNSFTVEEIQQLAAYIFSLRETPMQK